MNDDLPIQQRLIAEKIINDSLFQAEMGNLRLPHGEFNVREFYRTTPSPPTYQPQQFIRATPTPSHPAHRPQQFIREIPTPSPPIHHSQQFNQGTPILSPPTQHSQQFMHCLASRKNVMILPRLPCSTIRIHNIRLNMLKCNYLFQNNQPGHLYPASMIVNKCSRIKNLLLTLK
ncbi:unnamed protein product [Acanthoscelides obtectus]|uniref:Uncharacterized protein n=1 Tax=Acanthoscelides obtectus TaxID=200917 RepID=A0A9P0MAI0_ACAOB|nr:unnamed protein product [Acanthoscelides obtectus]CAK1625970.1 hypothetical protein AOBTE_LOCUS3508 [Acanthoscelides obtectus]